MSEPLYAVQTGTYRPGGTAAALAGVQVSRPCQDIVEAPEGLPIADAFKVALARAGWKRLKAVAVGGYRQDAERGPA